MAYLPRIVDRMLAEKLTSAGATCIRGPKWCGKTETAAFEDLEQNTAAVRKLIGG